MNNDLIKKDLQYLWHPCSQMQDYESFPPLEILSAKGSIIYTRQGEILDIISSWWCKSLGHGHPNILAAVKKQIDKFEHVILANTTHELIVELCENILTHCPGYQKIFFCDSGSDAVEVAMKMALQYQQQIGETSRTKFISLENGYHGETILTLAAGDCGLFGRPFQPLMPKITKLRNLPYSLQGIISSDPSIEDKIWNNIQNQLEPLKDELAAIILEPILQGAGGMLFYQPDLLRKLSSWCKTHGVLLIADEILTGMGRLGYARACEMVNVLPDFSVFSKGLTSGFSPLSCVVTTDKIYQAFYDKYETGKAFMHSNTYCGNAVGVAAANAALTAYREENIFAKVRENSPLLFECFQEISTATGALRNIRAHGFVVAADLQFPNGQSIDAKQRVGYKAYQAAVKRGLLLRPIGNTIYFLPPLNISKQHLQDATVKTIGAIKEIFL